MNNKGFNWFFPIVIVALLFFFMQPMLGSSEGKNIGEDEFYQLVKDGKVQKVVVYRDTYNADVFLTAAAKKELREVKRQNRKESYWVNPYAAAFEFFGKRHGLFVGKLARA